LANGSGWFRVQRGGVSSRFEGILCSRNRKEGREGQASCARRWSDGTESIFPQASAGEGGEKENEMRRTDRKPCSHLSGHHCSWKTGNTIKILKSSKLQQGQKKDPLPPTVGHCLDCDGQYHPKSHLCTAPQGTVRTTGCSAPGCCEPQRPLHCYAKPCPLQGII